MTQLLGNPISCWQVQPSELVAVVDNRSQCAWRWLKSNSLRHELLVIDAAVRNQQSVECSTTCPDGTVCCLGTLSLQSVLEQELHTLRFVEPNQFVLLLQHPHQVDDCNLVLAEHCQWIGAAVCMLPLTGDYQWQILQCGCHVDKVLPRNLCLETHHPDRRHNSLISDILTTNGFQIAFPTCLLSCCATMLSHSMWLPCR